MNGELVIDLDHKTQAQQSNIKQWKNRARKASDRDFYYTCEWLDCRHVSESLVQFNKHINEHRIQYLQYLCENREEGRENINPETNFVFECKWRECGTIINGNISEFSRHAYYHTFHQYLKNLGQHIIKSENRGDCCMDPASRNIIPDLPAPLICQWKGCGEAFDNPYLFYHHVEYHCEDFRELKGDPKVPLFCQWDSCKNSTKAICKMKEHVRTHTQAKVVACPTCGSLFASNTKFIDHLERQKPGKEFTCQHCSRQFGSERVLKEHMRKHVHFYKCDFCDMTCPSPSHIREHVRYRHSEERLFECEHCDYKAKSANDLRRHMNFHDEKLKIKKEDKEQRKEVERIYQCHVCPKRYLKGATLTDHLLNCHHYKKPSGHKKFSYKLHADGLRRLQTIRLESVNVSQQIIKNEIESQTAQLASSESLSAGAGEKIQSTGQNNEKEDLVGSLGISTDDVNSLSMSEVTKKERNDAYASDPDYVLSDYGEEDTDDDIPLIKYATKSRKGSKAAKSTNMRKVRKQKTKSDKIFQQVTRSKFAPQTVQSARSKSLDAGSNLAVQPTCQVDENEDTVGSLNIPTDSLVNANSTSNSEMTKSDSYDANQSDQDNAVSGSNVENKDKDDTPRGDFAIRKCKRKSSNSRNIKRRKTKPINSFD